MELRRLGPTDLASFYEIRLRALQTAPTAFLSTYDQEKADGPGRFAETRGSVDNSRAIFGAVVDGNVVATLAIGREERTRINHKATIWGVFVDIKYRGDGLAGKLLDLAIQFAIKEMQGVRALGLSVESENTSAAKVYASR